MMRKIAIMLDGYRLNPSMYEEFLCYTMQGICFIEVGDYISAMNSFLNSLKSATESRMTNLEWKALFNIMQLNLICGNDASAEIYAQRTKDILSEAVAENPQCKMTFERMLEPVFNRLNKNWNEHCGDATMLSVSYDKYLFVIMN